MTAKVEDSKTVTITRCGGCIHFPKVTLSIDGVDHTLCEPCSQQHFMAMAVFSDTCFGGYDDIPECHSCVLGAACEDSADRTPEEAWAECERHARVLRNEN